MMVCVLWVVEQPEDSFSGDAAQYSSKLFSVFIRYPLYKSFHAMRLNEPQHDKINDKAYMRCRDSDNNDHPHFLLK